MFLHRLPLRGSFLLISTVMMLLTTIAWSQETRGTVIGRVVDASGAVVHGVQIHALNPETGTIVTGKSNDRKFVTVSPRRAPRPAGSRRRAALGTRVREGGCPGSSWQT